MAQSVHIFAEREFDAVSRSLMEQLRARIHGENPNYLLNVNRTEYLGHIVSEFEIAPLGLNFDGLTVSSSEKMVRAELFPPTFHVHKSKSYSKQVVKYHLPFSGDPQLLGCAPNPRVMNSHPVTIEGSEVCFEIIDFSGNAENIKRNEEQVLGLIRQQAENLEKNIAAHNGQLRPHAEGIFDTRKAQIMKQNQVVAALGVPIKKAGDIPKTFAVPAVSRKPVVPKPYAPSEKYVPEPTLDQAIYDEILQTILDTGRVFERLPSTYAGKDEETLRDHLILNLEPRFQISTTGETFNKSGKTDILMRHEGKNIFVAECKFWRGQKVHHQTIDQLLSYLTWRDSKTAIVYFMDTKEIVAPLRAIEESTPQHTSFVAAKGKRNESWLNYELHLPDDHSRPVHVAILCFHVPK